MGCSFCLVFYGLFSSSFLYLECGFSPSSFRPPSLSLVLLVVS